MNEQQLEAAPGKADQLLATLSRAKAYADAHEPGCLLYRISHDPHDKHKVCVLEVYVRKPKCQPTPITKGCQQKDMAALEAHIETEVSKANVAFYAAGGLSKPLDEQDIRIHTVYEPEPV